MRRFRTLLPALAVLAVVAPSLALTAPAHALSGEQLAKAILIDYADDQKLEVCKYTEKNLRDVRNNLDNDIDQYAPDLRELLDAAIAKRAAGGCAGGGGQEPAQSQPGAGGGNQPAPPAASSEPATKPGVQQAAPEPAATPVAIPALAQQSLIDALAEDAESGTPAGVIGVALLIGLLVLMGALYAGARWWAWEPQWLVRLRHATAEAGWRASATWAEFTDFVRFGR